MALSSVVIRGVGIPENLVPDTCLDAGMPVAGLLDDNFRADEQFLGFDVIRPISLLSDDDFIRSFPPATGPCEQ